MKFFKSSMNCFFPSVSFPVTRYSTDTPRAWAIVKASKTSGNVFFEIHASIARLWNPHVSDNPRCVVFDCLIRAFTRFQKFSRSILYYRYFFTEISVNIVDKLHLIVYKIKRNHTKQCDLI